MARSFHLRASESRRVGAAVLARLDSGYARARSTRRPVEGMRLKFKPRRHRGSRGMWPVENRPRRALRCFARRGGGPHMTKRILFALTLGAIFLSVAVPSQATSCDRTTQTCLLNVGMTGDRYIPAAMGEFTTPAQATKAGYSVTSAKGFLQETGYATLVSAGQPGGYDTWSFVFRAWYPSGQINIDLGWKDGKTDGGSENYRNLQTPASGLKVRSAGGSGTFWFTARRDVKATVKVVLKGKSASGDTSHCNPYQHSCNGWTTIAKTSTSKLERKGVHQLRTRQVDTGQCRRYVRCKIVTTGLIYTRATPNSQWYKSKFPGPATTTHRLK
jgi:hypothetical protein